MGEIKNGFIRAFQLIVSFDPELYEIIIRSLFVSLSAVIISALFCIPFAIWLGLKRFKGKQIVSRLLYASMSTPSVVIGLIILLLLSRKGPLGFAGLLYTTMAMIIAQTVLVSPLVLGLTYHTVKLRGRQIQHEGLLLGANSFQIIVLIIRELKMDFLVHLIAGFSRAISEVGAVMIVGGNIRGVTRVMTTTIALMNSMGEYDMAIALGVVLLLISLIVNSIVYKETEPWK
ncbi:ABC transporter permease [Cellulosilyticum sp. I15G10I2]|uniref:ABC transporter permease n=1 Tax=Cellulosilyticum sp. I15G10I2 TaxID=1892843 RepID=UPI00085BBEED|nr:ABC transporter permease [Cellulosilyticum sp. I15G10I2]